jgi:hypothetical protein
MEEQWHILFDATITDNTAKIYVYTLDSYTAAALAEIDNNHV